MKTKAILSSLLVCIVTTLSAQINLNDSTVQVVAYWSKGDSYDYLYDYYKYNIQGKDTISWERTISKINITVIDSTENSYTLQAVYDTPNAMLWFGQYKPRTHLSNKPYFRQRHSHRRDKRIGHDKTACQFRQTEVSLPESRRNDGRSIERPTRFRSAKRFPLPVSQIHPVQTDGRHDRHSIHRTRRTILSTLLSRL